MLTVTPNRRPKRRMTETYKETPNNWQMVSVNMKQIVILSGTQMMWPSKMPKRKDDMVNLMVTGKDGKERLLVTERDGKERLLVMGRDGKGRLLVMERDDKGKLMPQVSNDCSRCCNQFLLKEGTCSTGYQAW
jgi:hypothetical protein